jgi:hypothetical protein
VERLDDLVRGSAPAYPTSNRRFLPVLVETELNLDWLRANVGQLIGEAAHLESKGETFAIPKELWGVATERQEAARTESDIETKFSEWFGETSMTGRWSYITAGHLVDICMIAGWRSNNSGRGSVMKRLGFRSENPYVGGKKVRVWVRGPETLPQFIEREGVRYMVGADNVGRAKVTIHMPAGQPVDGRNMPPMPDR